MTSLAENLSLNKYKAKISDVKAEDLGNVRHPRRLIKIYKRIDYRQLYRDVKDKQKNGRGTVYVEDISIVKSLKDEADAQKYFGDKWIHLAYLEGEDQVKEWYIFSPDSNGAKSLERKNGGRKKSISIMGIDGFAMVSEQEVRINAAMKDYDGWTIQLLDEDLFNCSFGFNYDQPAQAISLMISNDKGKNRGRFKSGDIVKVYMWYDKPNDIDFARDVSDWAANDFIADEDAKFAKVNQEAKSYKYGSSDDEVSYKYGVNLMFSGMIDSVNTDYSKQGGNKMALQGRSFGFLLNSGRIWKSYPSEGRITMPHEEIIYDMVTKQTGLPIAHLALEKADWMIGGVPPEGVRKTGGLIKFNEMKIVDTSNDLDEINQEELKINLHQRYETEMVHGIKLSSEADLKSINIEGIVELGKDFQEAVFENTNKISSTKPPNNGLAFSMANASITGSELAGKGSCIPIWIFSDGKTGKDNNGGYPNTTLKSIIEIIAKLRRKQLVELKPDKWSEYGIRVPRSEKRSGGTVVNPVRLFFFDGWNAVKYVLQERAISTSSARHSKLQTILSLESSKSETAWKDAKESTPLVTGDVSASKFVGYDEGKVRIYQVSDKDIPFNPIAFAKNLGVLNDGEVKPEKESKSTKNKQGKKQDSGNNYVLLEEAIDPESATAADALLRLKLFYQSVRQLTRAFHDKAAGEIPRLVYANSDSLKAPVPKEGGYAVEFPVVKKGQKIVLPLDIVNAPRTWNLGVDVRPNSDGRYVSNLLTDINAIWTRDKNDPTKKISDFPRDFTDVVKSPENDELDPKNMWGVNAVGDKEGTLNKVGSWGILFPDGYSPSIGPYGTEIQIRIIEDAAKLKQLKQEGKDLVFEGETVFDSVKKITEKYFDVIQYVDEHGFYNVRPRGAPKLVGQVKEYILQASASEYPKYEQGKVSENASQTINRVVMMASSPGLSEVVIVVIDDKESIQKYGIKQTFVKENKINNSIEAIKKAKRLLLSHRQKLRKVDVVCEPIFELRPGHVIHLWDIASGLSGKYLVDNIGINYSKNGGAVQSFSAISASDIYDTSALEGKVSYYSKEGDTLKLQKQYSEKEIRAKVEKAARDKASQGLQSISDFGTA